MSIIFSGYWLLSDDITKPEIKMKLMVQSEDGDNLRDATGADLFRAGFTTQALALEEIKKKNREIKAGKVRKEEILQSLLDLVRSIKILQEQGLTFDDFGDAPEIQDALEQAEDLLNEEEMDI